MSTLLDRTGHVYGWLTVVERAEDYVAPSGKHLVQWLCRCRCGKTTIVTGNKLKSGHTKSCGCLVTAVLEGRGLSLSTQRFGKLTALAKVDDDGPRHGVNPSWICWCDCERFTVVFASNLTRGGTTSCGCVQRTDVMTYWVAHSRMRRARGSARLFDCADCLGSAAEWSYMGDCPDELLDGVLRYCPHPEHYEPRCRRCHRAFDRAYSRA